MAKKSTESQDNTRQHPTGPTSIEGVEASDLPDQGRGSVNTDPGHELARTSPHKTGGPIGDANGGDVGIRGTPDVAEADQHGNRGRN